jgi:putative SOS response-associated peptidase YedK
VCGRYASASPVEDMAEAFGIRPQCILDPPPLPSYNVAPTDPVPGVLIRRTDRQADMRQLRTLHWGLLPPWATDARSAARRINARVETVAARPAFRGALAARRCLLPASGYFEWTSSDSTATAPVKATVKQPYFLHPADGGLLAFAGLYERWSDADGATRWTCTILTTAATGPLSRLHDRMPMVVSPTDWTAWLDPTRTDPAAALRLPVCPAGLLAAYPVHARVGNVRATGPELVAPLSGRPVF